MQYLTRVTGEEYIIMPSLILIKSDGTEFFCLFKVYICILVLLHNCILFSVKSLKILE